mgnify:CR=1 FL=1
MLESASLMPLDRDPNLPNVWRNELIFKISFIILLLFNVFAIWFVPLETKLLRYLMVDFGFCIAMCSYQLVYYVGPEPLENKLCDEFVVCIFIFRSFRSVWTHPNLHGVVHIIAGIMRMIIRNFYNQEPVWARDPAARV